MSYFVINNIKKNYKDIEVLHDVSLEVQRGELATLLGPSGCGKSTLLRILAGLESISSGTVFLDGKDITNLPPQDRNIGMVFQEYSLFPSMTVYDNIEFGLKRRRVGKKERARLVDEVLAMTDLKGKENKYPSTLSGGEKQRVALARSVVTKPKVLLLDEPLSAIDAKLRRSLQDRIKELQRELNITTIFVTHDQDEAMRISDTIHLMNNGLIEQSGSPLEIYSSPNSLFVGSFVGSYNIFHGIDMNALFSANFEESKSYGIRPEKIKLNSTESSAFQAKGVVLDLVSMGSVIRYIVETNDHKIQVDKLNEGADVFSIGEIVTIHFDEQDIFSFRRNEHAEK